jgi:uncharacterized caspase-like protein
MRGNFETSSDIKLYDKSYAVIIGIDKYEKWPSLDYAVNDAKLMEKKLMDLGFRTVVLTDEQATRSKILTVLDEGLPLQTGKDDRVVIFFAGHGETEEVKDGNEVGYLIPVDGDSHDLNSTAISIEQIKSSSQRMIAKHAFYIFDCCLSGLGLSSSGTLSSHQEGYFQRIMASKAHQVLAAGGKGEQVRAENRFGVFTKYLLEAMSGGADPEGKGYVTFSGISAYVRSKIGQESHNLQIPQYGNIRGNGEFVFLLKALKNPQEEQEGDKGGKKNALEFFQRSW